jgi:4-oxalocrotonate tautomerase
MPLIQVTLIERVFSDRQKEDVVRTLTDAMVPIEGEQRRAVTRDIVEEVGSGSTNGTGPPPTRSQTVPARTPMAT